MSSDDRLPGYGLGEEIAHAVTHGIGLALSLGALAALVLQAAVHGDAWHVASSILFGTTLVLLYAASTLYHALTHRGAKRVFQRLDHAAIYLLIAGSYTPFTLVSLRGGLGFTLLAFVWGLAILGIVIESVGRTARPRLALHLCMGWSVLFAAEPLVRTLEPAGLALLAAGGLAYTAGVPFYAWKRLPYNHAIWHVFVLVGSACHFACVLRYVIPAAA
jgi:hemolysin III